VEGCPGCWSFRNFSDGRVNDLPSLLLHCVRRPGRNRRLVGPPVIQFDEVFTGYANLLYSRLDYFGVEYKEVEQPRAPISLWLEGLPNLTLHVLTPVDWEWDGEQGYIRFGLWMKRRGGEPFFTWSGDSPHNPVVVRGMSCSLGPRS
jgi:hypothetical protein